MYPGVPSAVPVRVSASSSAVVPSEAYAVPKSSTRGSVRAPFTRKTLLGLTSRWMTPRACAAASAPARHRPSATLSPIPRAPRARRAARLSPSSHSMARYGPPAAVTPCAT